MMPDNTLIEILNNQLDTNFPETIPKQLLVEKLSIFIDDLIQNNFQKLVAILYKIDVSEKKLKQLLQESEGVNAAGIISTLIIERQQQKIESRKKFSPRPGNDEEEEKW
jgi:hypothetical protein